MDNNGGSDPNRLDESDVVSFPACLRVLRAFVVNFLSDTDADPDPDTLSGEISIAGETPVANNIEGDKMGKSGGASRALRGKRESRDTRDGG